MMTLMMINLIRSRRRMVVGILLEREVEMRNFPLISRRILEVGLEEEVGLEDLEVDSEVV